MDDFPLSSQVRILALAFLLPCVGCSWESDEAALEAEAQAENAVKPHPSVDFEPPPWEEISAAQWNDMPVWNIRDVLRRRLADIPPTIDAATASTLRNNSEEDNEKLVRFFAQLPEDESQVDYDATLIHHSQYEPKSLNPLLWSSIAESQLMDISALRLIGFDAEFTPFAFDSAVESWQTSSDHRMDKFVLRKDLTWSDGEPVTAHDVEFSFQTILNPAVPAMAVRSSVAKLLDVHAYDDHMVVMFQQEPLASWVQGLQFPIIPEHIYGESVEDDPTLTTSDYHRQYERQPVTCGPYEYVSYRRGQEVVLRRRKSYYMHDGKQARPKPYFREIRVRTIVDSNTALLALKSGELDELQLTSEQWLTQTAGEDFYRRNTKLAGVEWVNFFVQWNCESIYFSDKRVRQAMSYALDYEELHSSVFYNLHEPGTGVFHPTARMASPNIAPREQDFDKAEALLDEAGWDDSDGDGVRDLLVDGRLIPFEFTLITYQRPEMINAAMLLKDNLDQIGIICYVKPTEFTVKTQLALDHKFTALMGGWGTGTDPATLKSMFGTGQDRNYNQYSNPRVDELFKLADREFDEESRAALYAEMHEILWEDQPYLWMFWRSSLFGINKHLRGFNFSPRAPFGVQPGLKGLWKVK